MEVTAVIKVGGRLLAHPQHLDATLATLAGIAKVVSMLVVPGGGAFADAVRDIDRRLGLSDDAAHWMAALAMDQYAHLITARLSNASLVLRPGDVATLTDGQIPVLAPYQWLREADPLPHSWDVTSDSISAWVAGQVGARRLVLVKAPGAYGADIVDPFFERSVPAHVNVEIVSADRIDELHVPG